MDLSPVLETYFRGERQLGLSFVYTGIALLGVAYFAWRSLPGSFGMALAVTALVVGLGLSVSGAWFERKTEAQVAALQQSMVTDAPGAITSELARMEKVNRAWPVYLVVWAAFGIVGLALRFGTRGDFTQGLGIALVFFSGGGLLVDGFAERRARPYTEALEAASPPARQP
jgi:hypothetical protein